MPSKAGDPQVLWTPSSEMIERSGMWRYMRWLESNRGLRFEAYGPLHEWSVRHPEEFWSSLWDYFALRADAGFTEVLSSHEMPGAKWFAGARLNYAEHALRAEDARPAIIACSEFGPRRDITYGELRRMVAATAAGLKAIGIGPGDRVAGFLPNVPEAVVCLLASASIGAVWSSCPPDFGLRSVIGRFAQIEPKAMIGVDGYVYGGKRHDRLAELAAIESELPSVGHTVVVPNLDPRPALSGLRRGIAWPDLGVAGQSLDFEPVEFEHPLWILYSSGTTGLPKPIVHGHGGILLEHLKSLALHRDVGSEDTFFWHTTTGWMMWNLLVGGLLTGGAIVLYDGSPAYPGLDALWRLAADTETSIFGAGAVFLHSCMKAGLAPGREHDLTRLRSIGSTGSPLAEEAFRWVYRSVAPDVLLAPGSGGTDVCTAFVGPCPLLPVVAGEMQCRLLGASVEAFDADGHAVIDQLGELVVTEPMPSMPLFLWGDEGGRRLRESYFSTYPGVWRHGDWIRITQRGSCVITGRSDSTLNRGGVRMGTSEFYDVVESLPEIRDSIVAEVPAASTEDGSQLVLFVVLTDGFELSPELVRSITTELREQLSPRHVPDEIIRVKAIPRTLTGKKMEVPVTRLLAGDDPALVASADAMQDAGALAPFVELGRHRRGPSS